MMKPRKRAWPLMIGSCLFGLVVAALALSPRSGPPAATAPPEGSRSKGAAETGPSNPRETTGAGGLPADPSHLGAGDGAPGSPAGDGAKAILRLLVPAYFYPSGPGLDLWDRLLRGCERAPLVIVVNPASGPGEEPDPNYAAIIRRAAKQGATVVGYVNTQYAKRDRKEVSADIDRWFRFYPETRGIFLDMQASETEKVDYYASLREHVRTRVEPTLVITNPGTICAEEYFSRPATDAACIFEVPEGFNQFRLPAWSDRYPPAAFVALPYHVEGVEAMRACIRQAVEGRIGVLYVTDASGPDPWSRLPRYWEAEIDAVHRVNQRQLP